MIRTALRKFKYMITHFRSDVREIRQKTSPARLDEKRKTFLKGALEYIMQVGKDITISDMEEELQVIGADELREIYMTLAEQFIAKGKDKGRLEGQRLAKQQVLLRLLEKKFSPADVAYKHKVNNCRNRKKLDRAIDLLLDANTVDEVLQPLG